MANKNNTRVDAIKNKAKVIASVVKDPLQSITQISKDTWLSIGNVHDKLKEVERTGVKDDRIISICDTDLVNVVLWQNELQKRLQEQASDLKTEEIVKIIAEWTKRYSLFKWEATDKDWWLKEPISVNIIVWWVDNIDS